MKSKVKGGGTSKVCLPARKVASMSPAEKKKVVNAKRSAASKGKYRRSSKSNVKGARKKGARKRIVGKDTRRKVLRKKVTEKYLTACL